LEGGSYYEFGIFRGYALWFVQDMTRRLAVNDFHCHGFDSFQGLPAPTGVGDEGAPWPAGAYAVPRWQVEKYLGEFKGDFQRISLHEGFFSDELFASFKEKVDFRRAALVLVDCDLYSSTVPVLRFIRDYLADGTIVLFDDYNCFNAADERGQRRALSEFLTKYPDVRAEPLRPFGWHGQGFRIRRATGA
jgi:O-methyltransferase